MFRRRFSHSRTFGIILNPYFPEGNEAYRVGSSPGRTRNARSSSVAFTGELSDDRKDVLWQSVLAHLPSQNIEGFTFNRHERSVIKQLLELEVVQAYPFT